MNTTFERVRPVATPAVQNERTIKLIDNVEVGPVNGINSWPITFIGGFRNITFFVKYDSKDITEPPIHFGLQFALDEERTMATRRLLNLEATQPIVQDPLFIDVACSSGNGEPAATFATFAVRLPVMGPYVMVFITNDVPRERRVSVWAYLTQ